MFLISEQSLQYTHFNLSQQFCFLCKWRSNPGPRVLSPTTELLLPNFSYTILDVISLRVLWIWDCLKISLSSFWFLLWLPIISSEMGPHGCQALEGGFDALQNPRWAHTLTCIFCLLCHSRAKHNSNIKKIPLCQSWWQWAFGNIEGGILNTPVTPQRVMDGIFSGCLQGPHFHAGVGGPRGSLRGRVVWVGAWGDTVIQTVSFVNFRLISWFWNSKGKHITMLQTRMDTEEAWKADSTWINVRSTHLRVLMDYGMS